MEFTLPLENVHNVLNYICVLWATFDEEVQYTLDGEDTSSGQHIFETGDCYDILCLDNIRSPVHILQENLEIDLFSKQFPWPNKRF